MKGKFDSSLLSVGNDISEVRNKLSSIFQYLDIESIRLDLFDIILEKIKEPETQNPIKNQKLEDLSVIQISNESQIHVKNDLSHLQFLKGLTTSEIRKKMLIKLVYPKIKELLEELVRTVNEQPIKVNPMHVLLIEFIFDMSNHKPLKHKFIDNKRQVESDEKTPYKRISLLDYAEIQRHTENFFYIYTSMLTDEALSIHSYKILTENISSTDSRYPLYFAFTLSQCSVFKIKEFLDFQKSLFEGDFNDFLKITVLVYKNLFSEAQLTLLSSINFNKKLELSIFSSESIHNHKEINFNEDNILNIAVCLQPYIEPNHYEILIKALKGEIIDNPVHFKGSSSGFARQLKSLYENDFVQEKNLDKVVDWAIKNFIFDSRLNGIGQPTKKSHFEREIRQKLPKRFQSFFENLIKNK